MMKKALKIALFAFYFLVLLGVIGKLFFEEPFDRFLSSFQLFQKAEAGTLVIGLSDPLVSLNPLGNDSGSRQRLNHIYEALVKISPDLNIEPALALSFGAIDDLTWEFRLRPGVTFHSGAPLTFEDVLTSLEAAQKNRDSSVKDLASSIEEISRVDDQIFRITTSRSDPLFLQKLSYLYIFPANAPAGEVIGTGPYELEKNEPKVLMLRRYQKYWGLTSGNTVIFPRVQMVAFSSKDEKLSALRRGSVDIVGNVPPDTARDFQFSHFDLKTIPSLEANFLMFHLGKTFRSRELREAVLLTLNTAELAGLTQGFAAPIDQFVSPGIYGYDLTIQKSALAPAKASELVKAVSNFERVGVTLDLPKGLEVFGANVREQLRGIGIDTELAFHTPSELSDMIRRQASEFYFFGWRSDLGDAGDFLNAAVHSKNGEYGQFNGGNYRNSEVDQMLELAQETVNPAARLEKLRSVMRRITSEDIIGVPLFSPEVLYGVSKKLQWKPRVDGMILAQEVKL